MIAKPELIEKTMEAVERLLREAGAASHEECVQVLQVVCEVALSSTAANQSFERVVTLWCDAIRSVADGFGAEVTVENRSVPPCSTQKH